MVDIKSLIIVFTCIYTHLLKNKFHYLILQDSKKRLDSYRVRSKAIISPAHVYQHKYTPFPDVNTIYNCQIGTFRGTTATELLEVY